MQHICNHSACNFYQAFFLFLNSELKKLQPKIIFLVIYKSYSLNEWRYDVFLLPNHNIILVHAIICRIDIFYEKKWSNKIISKTNHQSKMKSCFASKISTLFKNVRSWSWSRFIYTKKQNYRHLHERVRLKTLSEKNMRLRPS